MALSDQIVAVMERATGADETETDARERMESRLLRDVRICGHRLIVWDDHTHYGTGQHRVRFAFYLPRARTPLFVSECGVAPSDPIDSDAALVGILGWLVLKPGDTDSGYFAEYTAAQLDWCQGSAAEEIGLYVYDAELPEDDSEGMLRWRDGRLCCGRKRVFRAR